MNASAAARLTAMMTPEEVAADCAVPVSTVKGWLRTGVLPGVKLGYKTWRIRRTAFEAFLDSVEGGAAFSTDNADGIASTSSSASSDAIKTA